MQLNLGGAFKAKDTRENQSDKEKVSSLTFISNYREYIRLEMPTTRKNIVVVMITTLTST